MLTKCASAQVSFRRDNSTVYVPSEFNSTVYMASEYCKAGKAKILRERHVKIGIVGVFFHLYIFQNYFLQKYIFGFTIYRFIPLPPGWGAAGGLPPVCGAALPGGRGSHGGPYRPARGGRLPPNIKDEPPLHLHLQQTTSIEGKRRDVG